MVGILRINLKNMALLQIVQKNLALLGFIRNRYDYHYYPFNREHLKTMLIFAIGLIQLYTFAFHSAKVPREYMDSFYMITVLTAVFLSYAIVVWNMIKLFNFIDGCDEVINKSK